MSAMMPLYQMGKQSNAIIRTLLGIQHGKVAAPSLDPMNMFRITTKHLQKRFLKHRTWAKIPSPAELFSQGTQGEWSAQKQAGEHAAPAPHHLPEEMSEHLFSSLRVLRKPPTTEGSDLTHKIQRKL